MVETEKLHELQVLGRDRRLLAAEPSVLVDVAIAENNQFGNLIVPVTQGEFQWTNVTITANVYILINVEDDVRGGRTVDITAAAYEILTCLTPATHKQQPERSLTHI